MPDNTEFSAVIRHATAVLPDGPRQVDIGLRHGKIDRIAPSLTGYQTEYDADGCTVIPGMIDIHTHGAMGVDVNHAAGVNLKTFSDFMASEGITGFYPSVISDSPNRMISAVRTIAEARGMVQGAKILGCHLEGPFIAQEYKGVIPGRYLQPGNIAMVTRLLQAAGSCKLRMTVSPEAEGMEALLGFMLSQRMQISLGHSGAGYDQTMRCIKAGVNSFTHVMNGMRPLDIRKPGILGAALESDAYCEFICDGLHLHPANVRLLLKAKGLHRLVAVSDSILATGLGDGRFRMGSQYVIVKGLDALLRNGVTRAGSLLTLRNALHYFMQFTGLPLAQAILPMTANPAALMGLGAQKGRIAAGMDADLTVLDEHFNVQYTFVNQRLVYTRKPKA